MKKTGYAHVWKEAYIRTNIQSYYHLFFSPDDPIDIARKKWYDYLGYDIHSFGMCILMDWVYLLYLSMILLK